MGLTKAMRAQLANNESCVVEIVNYHKDGSPYIAELFITPLFDNEGHRTHFVSIHRDVTERKQAENRLRIEHDFNQSIIATSQQVVVVLDTEGRILQFNPYLENVTGWTFDEVRGQNWFKKFYPAAVRSKIQEAMLKADPGVQTRGNINTILTKDGREREIAWFNAPLTDPDDKVIGLLCCGQDISDRRALERRLLDTSAEEQRRIGNDLHDGVGQELTGLSMIAQSLVIALSRASRPESAMAEKLSAGIHRSLSQVRKLARGMNPVDIDALGLMSSLSDMTQKLNELHCVRCTFECTEPILLRDNQTATQLFRIAQEATTNAIKHSKAEQIVIELGRTNDGASLRIADDGVGISQDDSSKPGMGLQTMQYRADIIGCSLRISKNQDRGTEVICEIPSYALYQA